MAKGPRGEGWRLAKHTPEANLRSTPRIKTPKTKIIFEGLFGVLGLENFEMVLQGYLLLVGCCCCLPAAAACLLACCLLLLACCCLPAACLLLACCCCWWLPAACLLPAFACLLLLLPAASCLLLPLCKHCAEKIWAWISSTKCVSPGSVQNRFGPENSTQKTSWADDFVLKPSLSLNTMSLVWHCVVLPCCFQNYGFFKISFQDFAFCRAPLGCHCTSVFICFPGCRIL